jgi:hypothetical protein
VSNRVRVLRLIEYSGPREQVEVQINRSMRDGTHGPGRFTPTDPQREGVTIKIATLGDVPEILERSEIENDPRGLNQIMREDGRKALPGYDGALDSEQPRTDLTDILADIKEDYR